MEISSPGAYRNLPLSHGNPHGNIEIPMEISVSQQKIPMESRGYGEFQVIQDSMDWFKGKF
jgi:hypothetical protein